MTSFLFQNPIRKLNGLDLTTNNSGAKGLNKLKKNIMYYNIRFSISEMNSSLILQQNPVTSNVYSLKMEISSNLPTL